MARKKRHFNCSACGSECEIYKKGKKHRVLVCPKCGILATNPVPLLAAGARILAPIVAGKVIDKITSGGDESTASSTTPSMICAAPRRTRTSGTWYVDKALRA